MQGCVNSTINSINCSSEINILCDFNKKLLDRLSCKDTTIFSLLFVEDKNTQITTKINWNSKNSVRK